MLNDSILGKLYTYWQNSFIYSVLAAIYHFFSRKWSESFIANLFKSEDKVQKKYDSCFITSVINALIDLILRVIAAVCKFLTPAWRSSGIVAFFSESQIVRFDFLFYAFLAAMFMVPHSMWSNTYAVLAACGFLFYYAVLCAVNKRKVLYPSKLSLPFLLFAAITPFTLLYSEDRSDSFRIMLFFLAAFVFTWIIASDVDNTEKLKRITGVIYVVVIFTAVYAIGQRIVGIEVNPTFIDAELNPDIPARVYSTVDNPNNYAELIVLFTPLSVVFAMNQKDSLRRFVLCCLIVLPMVALLMTYSRSGWLSIALTVVLFVYFTNKRLLPWVFVAAILCIPFLPASIMTRLGNLLNTADKSANFRLQLWGSCLRLLGMDNRWLTGIGLGPFTYHYNLILVAEPRVADGMAHTQMLYMDLFMQWGVMGFITYMWFICKQCIDGLTSLYRAKNEYVKAVLIACISSICGIAILSIFEYIWFYPRILFAHFIVVGILIACIRMVKEEK